MIIFHLHDLVRLVPGRQKLSKACRKKWWANKPCPSYPKFNQWPFQDPKLEVPTMYKVYFSGPCKGIFPENMAWKMVLTYHCRISFNHSITIMWLLLYDDFHIFYCHQTEQFLDQIFSHGNHGFSMEKHLLRGFSCPCLCEVPSGEKPDVLIKISIPLSAYIILLHI